MDEVKVHSPDDAQAIIMKRLRASYGRGIHVEFLRSKLETDLADGKRFWVIEGVVHIRRWLFMRRSFYFTYFVDAGDGRILIMRVKRA